MLENLSPFLLHWGITTISLWAASLIFSGLKFENVTSLIASALLLGLANALIKPLIFILTLPLTLLTLGLFVLVIDALMILLVASLIKGFKVLTFKTAFFASILVSVLSIVIESLVDGSPATSIQMPHNGLWL